MAPESQIKNISADYLFNIEIEKEVDMKLNEMPEKNAICNGWLPKPWREWGGWRKVNGQNNKHPALQLGFTILGRVHLEQVRFIMFMKVICDCFMVIWVFNASKVAHW